MSGILLALGGYKRAGKDEAGDYLESAYEFVKMGMSDALNVALQNIGPRGPWVKLDFDVIDHYPWRNKRYRGKYVKGDIIRYADLVDAVGYTDAKLHKDAREYLQGLGTEVGRDMIDPEVWVRIAEKKIRALQAEGKNVVITAIRFPNELEMVRRLGGHSVWIERSQELRGADGDQHASEVSLQSKDFEAFIDNNGSKDELRERVDSLLDRVAQVSPQAGAQFDDVHGWPQYDR